MVFLGACRRIAGALTKRRRKGGYIAVAVVVVLPVGLLAHPLSVAAKCQPGRSNNGVVYVDGFARSNGGAPVTGVWSSILNYSPWVQPGSSVLGLVALFDQIGSDYAFIGWREDAGGQRETWWQWNGPYSSGYGHGTAQPVGQHTNYTVYDSNANFTFQVASQTVDTESPGFSPVSANVYGEIETLADQMPGAVQAPEDWNPANAYLNGGWTGLNGGLWWNQGPWYYNKISSQQYETADAACTGT